MVYYTKHKLQGIKMLKTNSNEKKLYSHIQNLFPSLK